MFKGKRTLRIVLIVSAILVLGALASRFAPAQDGPLLLFNRSGRVVSSLTVTTSSIGEAKWEQPGIDQHVTVPLDPSGDAGCVVAGTFDSGEVFRAGWAYSENPEEFTLNILPDGSVHFDE